MNILHLEPLPSAMRAKIAAELPEVAFIDGEMGAADRHCWQEAEVLFGVPTIDQLEMPHRLRWIQQHFTGVMPELGDWCKRHGVVLTNSAGIYNQTIAEHVMALMLVLARRLDLSLDRQRRHRWVSPIGPPLGDLAGRTVGIVGMGGLGSGIARLCRAFSMRVWGCRRRPRPTAYFDRTFGPDEITEMARGCDWLVVAVPLTAETRGWIDAQLLSVLPSGARLINVARGAVIDEDALVDALATGHLAGAAIDVAREEPLPADSRLWDCPNLVITPHVASVPIDRSLAAWEMFLRNLHNWRQHKPLENVVDLDVGY